MEKIINVGGRLHNPVVGGALTGANEIKDDTKGKMQNVINQEADAELLRLDGAKQDKLTFDQTPTEGSTNPVTSGGVYAADVALQQAIETILLLIPSAASALNQLADKAFVNSSIATATATFRGTYNLVTDLELTVSATHQQIATALASVVSTADNNDYCFVQIPVSDQSTDIRVTERYKFDGTSWEYEYDLNNSGFTADQWGAINSGITSVLVSKLGGLPTAQELATMFAGKQNTLTFDTTPTSGSNNPVTSGGLYTKFATIDAMIPTGADANNKLVAESRLVAYVTTLINALDATINVTSADGHVTLRMTQADGVITSVQILTSDIASASALTTLGGRVSIAEADIDALQDAYAALTQSDVVIVEGALPSSGQQQNIIYRQPDQDHTPPQFYSDYMWNGTTWVMMATYNNAIDPCPKKGSQNLVTSGGVFDNMGALDVSELNATENPHTLATYADLSAALAAIPSDYQKGGMSIKFVLSNDNKYVQHFLTKNEWSIDPNDWEKMNLEEEVNEKVQISPDPDGNLFNPNDHDVVLGKYLNADGSLSDSGSFNTTGYIRINGDTHYYHADNSARFNVSVFYDENKNVINGSAIVGNHNDFVAPSNAHYVRISSAVSQWNTLQLATSPMPFEEFTPIGGYNIGSNKVKEKNIQNDAVTNSKIANNAVSANKIDAKSRGTLIEACVPLALGKNLFDKEDARSNIGHFLDSDGVISNSGSYAYTAKYIIVKPNTSYYYSRISDSKCTPTAAACVCFYDQNKEFISSQGADIKTITTPNNCYYIRVSVLASYIDTEVQLEEGASRTGYEEYSPISGYLTSSPIEKGFSYHGNMAANETVKLPYTNVNKNAIFSFTAQLNGTFDKLEIGCIRLDNTTVGESIIINNTNVYWNNVSVIGASVAHGLTISNNIQVIIEAENQYKLKQIILCSNGEIANIDVSSFGILLNKGYAFAKATSALDNVSFSWTTRDIDADVWVFGDSWVSQANNRWPYYLTQYGYDDNVLINGFSGEKTQEALVAFKTLLSIGTPKTLCWCMGGNNADSSDAINPIWKEATEEVMSLCNSKGIELILFLVATTPTYNHNFTNAYILASGYRYIDTVSAIGADTEGNWYPGFEQSATDHDHTSALGARAVFMQFMADVPELAIKK